MSLNSTKYVGENESLDTLWELVSVDARAEPEGGWTWNDKRTLKRFRSDSINLKGLCLRVLADWRGTPLPRGLFRVDDSDWNIIEVQRRRDGRPEWAIVRLSPQ